MSWEQELKTTLQTMMSTDTFTNKRCDDLKADVSRLIEKTMQNEQKLINLNHKFKMLMYNELTNWESATRVRRELQKNHPELRDDEVYAARHKRAEEYRDNYSSRYNFIGRK